MPARSWRKKGDNRTERRTACRSDRHGGSLRNRRGGVARVVAAATSSSSFRLRLIAVVLVGVVHVRFRTSCPEIMGRCPRETSAAAAAAAHGRGGGFALAFAPPGCPRGGRRFQKRGGARLELAAVPNFDSNDPYQVLGLSVPTADAKEIKRAYRKLALRYHPDVATAAAARSGGNENNSKEEDPQKQRTDLEAAKRVANDRFAKINWAYQVLSGKDREFSASPAGTASAAGRSSSSSSSSSPGWTPPHRRSASSSSSSSGSGYGSSGSTRTSPAADWRSDYVPRYGEDGEEYDAGGDSLGAIFRDMVAGAATGGRGVFRDFVEFLEANVDGYGAASGDADDDAELRVLLRTGSISDVGDEMDTTELVVRQLNEKQRQLDEELVLLTAEAKVASRYMDKLELDERAQEIKARKKVVERYIGMARKRLLSLQTRYKQMVVSGDNDPKAGGGARGRSSPSSTTRTYDSRAPASGSPAGSRTQYSPSSTSSSRAPRHDKPEDAWKDGSFGSFGRGRGSSRKQSTQQQTSTSTSDSTGRSSYSRQSSGSYSSSGSGAGRTAYRSPSATASSPPRPPPPPPRIGAYTYDQQMEDKRRLRALKVDEEFDKLKKDLGL